MSLHTGLDQALAAQREDPDRPDVLEFFIEMAEHRRQFGTPEAEQVFAFRHEWGDGNIELRLQVQLGEENAFLQFVPDEHMADLVDMPVVWALSIPADEMINMAKLILEHLPARQIPRVES